MRKWILLAVILFAIPAIASADCTYNGKSYSEGTVIGPYTCSGGKWVQ